jgi:hypothetical protein
VRRLSRAKLLVRCPSQDYISIPQPFVEEDEEARQDVTVDMTFAIHSIPACTPRAPQAAPPGGPCVTHGG